MKKRLAPSDIKEQEYIEILQTIELEIRTANELKKKEQGMKALTMDMSTFQNEEMIAFFSQKNKKNHGSRAKKEKDISAKMVLDTSLLLFNYL